MMSLPKILIVDDEAPARQRLQDVLSDIQAECPCHIVGMASNAQEALDLLSTHQPDILLLDVQMPEMTGIEFVQHLERLRFNPMPAIIFVTAYDEFALKAFEVHALDYLLKPVRAARLAEAIKRVLSLRQIRGDSATDLASTNLAESPKEAKRARECFTIIDRNRVLLVPVNDVLFLKAEQKYLTVFTKTRSYLLEESLSAIEQEMGDRLVRVHRNALVARNAIQGVERAVHTIDADGEHEKTSESWQIIVRDTSERLPISRRQWPSIKALIKN